MRRVSVQEADFDAGAELAALAGDGAGGVASFIGVVRAESGGQKLVAMRLEHYPGMTETMLARLADAAMARWALTGCTIIHRIGRLTPGANIVLVAAASRHRAEALAATAYLIDRLKTDAPFWKAEEFCTGGAAWVEAKPGDESAAKSWV